MAQVKPIHVLAVAGVAGGSYLIYKLLTGGAFFASGSNQPADGSAAAESPYGGAAGGESAFYPANQPMDGQPINLYYAPDQQGGMIALSQETERQIADTIQQAQNEQTRQSQMTGTIERATALGVAGMFAPMALKGTAAALGTSSAALGGALAGLYGAIYAGIKTVTQVPQLAAQRAAVGQQPTGYTGASLGRFMETLGYAGTSVVEAFTAPITGQPLKATQALPTATQYQQASSALEQRGLQTKGLQAVGEAVIQPLYWLGKFVTAPFRW
jgi:hypothetical protein